MTRAVCAAALALCAAAGDTAQATADRIHHLPGAGEMPSRQFSGFLDAGNGDRLHYWLVESEHDPASDPVALWLNGGPGASSLMGFFTEFGPYVMGKNNEIQYNPFTWAKRANVIFLESPAGVGFSYCDGNVSKVCWHDDDTMAAGNLVALRDFFERFPGLSGGGFHIWGESYAGVYVPATAQLVANADPPLPTRFLGFSVGNPCTADKYQSKHLGMNPDYAFSMGFIDDELRAVLTSNSCTADDGVTRVGCNAWQRFDLLTSAVSAIQQPVVIPGLGQNAGFLDPYDTSFTGSMNPYWASVATYLHRSDVRKAIHVEQLPPWSLFATRVDYHKQYLACADPATYTADAPQKNASMLPIYRELVDKGHSVMLYSGDDDPSVQWQGSLAAMRGVGLPEAASGGWRPWFYDEKPVSLELLRTKAPEWGPKLSAVESPGGLVLGGYVIEFQEPGATGSLTFTTVHGVGHMVPQFQPQASLHLFDRTMQAAVARRGSTPKLAPPLPATVFNTSNEAFYGDGKTAGGLGLWLERAQEWATTTPAASVLSLDETVSHTRGDRSFPMDHAPLALGCAAALAVVSLAVRRSSTWQYPLYSATSGREQLL